MELLLRTIDLPTELIKLISSSIDSDEIRIVYKQQRFIKFQLQQFKLFLTRTDDLFVGKRLIACRHKPSGRPVSRTHGKMPLHDNKWRLSATDWMGAFRTWRQKTVFQRTPLPSIQRWASILREVKFQETRCGYGGLFEVDAATFI